MERICAALVRWSLFAAVGVPFLYFAGLSWLGSSTPEEAERDSVGLGMGLALFGVVAFLISLLIAALGALGLWYSALSTDARKVGRYENERVLGAASLMALAVAAILAWRAF